MGEIRASFHSVGSSPTSSDDWKIAVSTGASWSAARIRMRVGMPSGPDALCGLRSFNNYNTPSLWTWIRFMAVYGLFPLSGSAEVSSLV